MEMNVDYATYRADMIKQGIEYQDFICEQLHSRGIVLQNMTSPKYQLKRENMLGLEIKFDNQTQKTGNLYIEIAEKALPRDGEYAPSGIYRDDESWLYGIGNYETFYIFSKKLLRIIHKSNPKWIKQFQPTATSKGFGIPVEKAPDIAARIIHFTQGVHNDKP